MLSRIRKFSDSTILILHSVAANQYALTISEHYQHFRK